MLASSLETFSALILPPFFPSSASLRGSWVLLDLGQRSGSAEPEPSLKLRTLSPHPLLVFFFFLSLLTSERFSVALGQTWNHVKVFPRQKSAPPPLTHVCAESSGGEASVLVARRALAGSDFLSLACLRPGDLGRAGGTVGSRDQLGS